MSFQNKAFPPKKARWLLHSPPRNKILLLIILENFYKGKTTLTLDIYELESTFHIFKDR